MMRSLTLAAVAAALAATVVQANPTWPECKPYHSLVEELWREQATPFCSSYLHRTCVTKTKTCTEPAQTTTVATNVPSTTVTLANPTTTATSVVPASTTITLSTSDCDAIPATPVPIGTSTGAGGAATSAAGTSTQGGGAGIATVKARGGAAKAIPTPWALHGCKPSKISAACGCMDIPTHTTTVTTYEYPVATSVVTSQVVATTTTLDTTTITATTTFAVYACACTDPAGWQFGFWDNPFTYAGGNNDAQTADPDYQEFDPTTFKTSQPYATGVTEDSSGSYDADNPGSGDEVYDTSVDDPAHLAIVQRGYFKAPADGTYTFAIATDADDIQLLWIGQDAYSGWTRPNADQVSTYYVPAGTAPSFTLFAGQYYPLRLAYGQCNGGAGWTFSITNDAGDDVTEGNIVQENCNPATRLTVNGYPYQQPFGQES